jgi:hypothetical protein
VKRTFAIFAAFLTFGMLARCQSPMADQAVCAQQAQKVFRIEKMEFRHKVDDPDALISFTSHYNPTLGHCFVEISEVYGDYPIENSITVTDAFEGVQVAWYVKRQDTTVVCTVTGKDCQTYAEWNAAVISTYGVQ